MLTEDEEAELSEIYQNLRMGCDSWWDRKRGLELIAKKKLQPEPQSCDESKV